MMWRIKSIPEMCLRETNFFECVFDTNCITTYDVLQVWALVCTCSISNAYNCNKNVSKIYCICLDNNVIIDLGYTALVVVWVLYKVIIGRVEKDMGYTESYYGLSHGTDKESADAILSKGFITMGNLTSWCGKGVYFYDIKAKAWWAAKRKCEEIKHKKGIRIRPTVILADITNIAKSDIFDLRVKKDLEEFEEMISPMLGDYRFSISGIEDEVERNIMLRAMLISFFADKRKSKLVIGCFRQRPQPLYEHAIEFADSLDMVFGIETIYCVKDTSIISNIRLGGSR